jgi:hypothetical protein
VTGVLGLVGQLAGGLRQPAAAAAS